MIIIIALVSIYVLWTLYIVVMALKRVRDAGQMTWPMKMLGYPLLFVGLVLDALVNVTVCTALFLELPRELTVTSRLIRHKQGEGWRAAVSAWVCVSLLDSLDPSGCHCK